MSGTPVRKYETGDAVTFVVEGNVWPGRIAGPSDHHFCTSCHCCPPDPEHRYDGSVCCPGPWYLVEHDCPCGCRSRDTLSFAEHELSPAGPTRHQRPPLGRLEGWKKPEGAVMITRPSKWGNPYKVEDHGRAKAIRLFMQDLRAGTLVTRPGRAPLGIPDAVRELAGRDLVCACAVDEACHGDVLIHFANDPDA